MLLVLLCILILILILTCYSNKQINKSKKNLVFTSAGDNTNFHKLWLSKNANYDLWVVYYGNNNSKYNIYKNLVDKIWKRKGSKFQNFNYIYKKYYNKLMNYERIYIVDDDIIMNTNDINKLFNISKEFNLWICQPAFLPTSKISHEITLQQPGNILRYTNFVEVNTPVFSKEALIKFMKYYDDSLIGWGIDYLYIWANGKDIENKYAIIDSIPCVNPHDTIKNGERELNKINNYETRAKVWFDYSNKIGCPYDWPHITYNTINATNSIRILV